MRAFFSKAAVEFQGALGIPIRVRLSLVVLAAFLIHFNDTKVEFASEIMIFLMLIAALYIHALAQAWAALYQGEDILGITISAAGASVSHPESAPPLSALSIGIGPVVSLTMWAAAMLAAPFLGDGFLSWIVGTFGFINLFVGLISLFPTAPMTGGLLLRKWLRHAGLRSADQVAGAVGLVAGVLFILSMMASYVLFGILLFALPAFAMNWRLLRSGRAKTGLAEG